MQSEGNSLRIVSEDTEQFDRAAQILNIIGTYRKIYFHLALGATALSDIDGASAAGASAAARKLTPKLDAEALVSGRTALGEPLPASPAGITSPAVITRACLSLIDHKLNIIDCGTFVPPGTEHEATEGKPAKNFTEQNSMDIAQTHLLFEAGKQTAQRYQDSDRLPVLAECVPGGTTTAAAVLRALGFKADKLLSSSIPGNKGIVQKNLIDAAFARLDQSIGLENLTTEIETDPLQAVTYLGDPMQAFACGFILETIRHGTTDNGNPKALVLAGGSQMLAVYALAAACIKASLKTINGADHGNQNLLNTFKERVIVITTKWVVNDAFADTRKLANLVDAPFVASALDFSQSRHTGLQAYEQGHVKEGVGAGASIVLAAILGKNDDKTFNRDERNDETSLIALIDRYYQAMVLDGAALAKIT